MRYGYATGFASPIKTGIDYPLLNSIKAAGYDFVEFPLALLSTLALDECERLAGTLQTLGLGADSCCNMFPANLRITGPSHDWAACLSYLDTAFLRMRLLGAKKVVFGSTGARNIPTGTTQQEGFDQVAEFVSTCIVPLLKRFDMVLAMEPIGTYEANFLNTLDDGMRIVDSVRDPRVRLLADSVHMLYEHEDPQRLRTYADKLEHIHICENDRALPLGEVSPGLKQILLTLADIGYDKTLSFEPMPYPMGDMMSALRTVKAFFH